MAAPRIPASIAHVALTVSDLERSIDWYTRLFGARPAFTGTMLHDTPHEYRLAVWPELDFALHHFVQGEGGTFHERRPGLDHLAFTCGDQAELDAWIAHLDELGITRSDVLEEPYGLGLAFRDPDDIALEFFVAA
ncbi:MAG: VOC family protein [Actinomycetota bacterium]